LIASRSYSSIEYGAATPVCSCSPMRSLYTYRLAVSSMTSGAFAFNVAKFAAARS